MLLTSLFVNSVNFHSESLVLSLEVSNNMNLPEYKSRPFYLAHRHLETIVPSFLYSPPIPNYERERLTLRDGDFLDLDWVKNENDQLIIISHGMEGDTRRHYVSRAANYFSEKGWDILAWNQRGCSGELNDRFKLTHHGSSDELSQVVEHALHQEYSEIVLLGFSMGGCQTLKYLSTQAIDDRVLGGVGFSVTFYFREMMDQIERPDNSIYKKAFLETMKKKFDALSTKFKVGDENIELTEVDNFSDFHEAATLKATGYETLDEFYEAASSGNWMTEISKPMLIVNAKNDPLLGTKNFPKIENDLLTVYYPEKGGHVGFSKSFTNESFMEDIALAFIEQHLLK